MAGEQGKEGEQHQVVAGRMDESYAVNLRRGQRQRGESMNDERHVGGRQPAE